MPKLRQSSGLPDFRYYTKEELASTTAPSGASLIGVEDAGGYFAGTDVEAILQELMAGILPGTYLRLDGTNVPTANYFWTTDLTTTGDLQATNVTGVDVWATDLNTDDWDDSTGLIDLLDWNGVNIVSSQTIIPGAALGLGTLANPWTTIYGTDIFATDLNTDDWNDSTGLIDLMTWDLANTEIDVHQDMNLGAHDLTTTGTGTFGQVNTDDIYSNDGLNHLFSWDSFNSEIDVGQDLNLGANDLITTGELTIAILNTDDWDDSTGLINLMTWDLANTEIDVHQDINMNTNDIIGCNALSVVEINNITSSLLINKTAAQDVELFSTTDINDAVVGTSFKIHRKNAGSVGDRLMEMYVDENGYGRIKGMRADFLILGADGNYVGGIFAAGNSKWEWLEVGNRNSGTFRFQGDGVDSIMTANSNNLIYGWERGADGDNSHTIEFMGINNSHADEHPYFECGGITDHSVNGDTRYVTFFTPKTSFPNMKSGINQAASGAVAGELWFDTSDVNTVKMGV